MRFAHRWRLANRRTVIRLINSGSAASSGMPFDLLLRSLHPKDLMPIRRQHLWLYPIDWRELSASIRFRRAKGRCEHCDGRWWDEERQTWRNGQGRPVALLQAPGSITEARTIGDRAPPTTARGTLAALCQRCHILHDGEEHRRRRWLMYRMRRALGDLFTGPYR